MYTTLVYLLFQEIEIYADTIEDNVKFAALRNKLIYSMKVYRWK